MAVIASPPPIPQPASRAGMSAASAGTMTAMTNDNSAAVAPAAVYPLMTPLNSTTNPTKAITVVASTGECEQSVPIGISTKPAIRRPT